MFGKDAGGFMRAEGCGKIVMGSRADSKLKLSKARYLSYFFHCEERRVGFLYIFRQGILGKGRKW